MSRQALYQSLLQAQQRGLDRNLQMNQDMMTNLGKLAGGIYKFADDKREDQAEQFDKEVEKERKGYLSDIEMFGVGTTDYVAAQQRLSDYDDEMAKRRESIVNRGFTNYLGFGDDPEKPSAKLDDVQDQYAEEFKPGTGARDAFKARRYETSILGAEGPGLGGVDDVTPTVANMAQQEEELEKEFNEAKANTAYSPRIGRYEVKNLKRNTDIRDRLELEKGMSDLKLESIPAFGEANRKEWLADHLVQNGVEATDAEIAKLDKMDEAELKRTLVRMKKIGDLKREITLEDIETLEPAKLKERINEKYAFAGIDMSFAISQYAALKDIDFNNAVRDFERLSPLERDAAVKMLQATKDAKAESAAAIAKAVGDVEVNKYGQMTEKVIEREQKQINVQIDGKLEAWEKVDKKILTETYEEMIKKAKQIKNDDLALQLENERKRIGALPDESISEASNRQSLELFKNKLLAEFDSEKKKVTDVELIEAKANEIRIIGKAQNEVKQAYDSFLVSNPEFTKATVALLEKKAKATAKGADTVAIDRELRQKGYELFQRGLHALEDQKEVITFEDLKDMNDLAGFSDAQLKSMAKSATAMAGKTIRERQLALATHPALSRKQQFEALQTIPESMGGIKGKNIKYEDFATGKAIVDSLINSDRPVTDEMLDEAGYTTPAMKKSVREVIQGRKIKKAADGLMKNLDTTLEVIESPDGTGPKTREQRVADYWNGITDDVKNELLGRGITLQVLQGEAQNALKKVAEVQLNTRLKEAQITSYNNKGVAKAKDNVLAEAFRYEFKNVNKYLQDQSIDPSSPEGIKLKDDMMKDILTRYPSELVFSAFTTEELAKLNYFDSVKNPGGTGGSVKNPPPKEGGEGEGFIQKNIPEPEEKPVPTQPISRFSEDASTKGEVLRKTATTSDDGLETSLISRFFTDSRNKEIYDGVVKEVGGETEFLNKAIGKSDDEIRELVLNNAPRMFVGMKDPATGKSLEKRRRVNEDDVQNLIKAVRAAEKFRKPIATEI